MYFRDILVFLDAGPASAGRLHLAAGIACRHGSDLSGVFLHQGAALEQTAGDNRPLLPGGLPSRSDLSRVPPEAATEQEVEDALRQHIRTCSGAWHNVVRGEAARLIALARIADLVVLGQTSPYLRPTPWWRVDEIIVGCGRPVLLVPYAGSHTEIGRRVLIAWDGSREAARALPDALPVMDASSDVTVMTVRNAGTMTGDDQAATRHVLRHLALHDIDARAEHPVRGSNSIADVLLSAAMDCCADLIVAGAYRHSPLREALVGGVSRGLLQTMTVPVLMSH